MNKGLGIIGAVFIAGAVVFVFLNKSKKTKDDSVTASKKDSVDVSPDNSASIIRQNNIHNDSVEFDNVKISAINTMYARHEEASKIMQDAVGVICKKSEVPEDENCKLEQISDELDKLLSEE
ncbi:hypothetical protein FYJ27_12130 [Anaerosalibacter bizertensis]|uniref:Uncharacterized protein n=1 Tax=Anaerosalibacter bizertensis TaxID=932217 RepID=A0A844FKE9_9FIRM|nr:hypothetical protein [Anaerosalibacter bizertensis]MSS44421.1 hypothetical protein [Anaerosalibacter bizertensis]